MSLFRLGVLVSGSGSNLQAIIDAIESGGLSGAEISVVISNLPDVMALDRASSAGIANLTVGKNSPDILVGSLESYRVDGIVLAGYLPILSSKVVERYSGRIINIHPSLIPKFCGKGFYGIHVHEAVIESGEKYTGATVHFVDEGIDTGDIILQKVIAVNEDDTPATLQKRVLETEHEILIEGIKELMKKGKVGQNEA